jgi:hypothetical protein
VKLNAFVAETRQRIFQDLSAGKPPSLGDYSEEVLKRARTKGQPQMGSTRYAPDHVGFEFIYPDPHGAAVLLTVAVPAPERIMFLPVPEWVISQIWQGEVTGSYHFLPDAEALLADFKAQLEPDPNARLFL